MGDLEVINGRPKNKVENPSQNERVEKVRTKIIEGLILHFALCSLCCFIWAEGVRRRGYQYIYLLK